jgi:hypothetical protein
MICYTGEGQLKLFQFRQETVYKNKQKNIPVVQSKLVEIQSLYSVLNEIKIPNFSDYNISINRFV